MTEARGRRGPYQKSIERREHILDAALEVFAEHGDGGALLQEIADRVGVKLPSLMYYFPSRDELLLAVVERRDALGADLAGGAEHAHDPVASARSAIRRGMAQPGLVKLFATTATAAADPAHPGHRFFAERYRRTTADAARGLKQDQETGAARGDAPAEHMARLLLAAVDGLLRQWLVDPTADPVPALETFVRLCGYTTATGAEAHT